MISGEPRLWSAYREPAEGTVRTDLTHAFRPGQPHFAGFGEERRETLFDRERGDAFTAHRYTLAGQWGTHVDPPAHFVAGARTLDLIPVEEMILPLAVLDITARVEADPDATPTLDDVRAWEHRNGPFTSGAFVALRTGCSRRRPGRGAGTGHTPGWSAEVLTYLFEDAGVSAIGHEQADTDPGPAASAGDHGLEAYVLGRDRRQIELLTNLGRLPE